MKTRDLEHRFLLLDEWQKEVEKGVLLGIIARFLLYLFLLFTSYRLVRTALQSADIFVTLFAGLMLLLFLIIPAAKLIFNQGFRRQIFRNKQAFIPAALDQLPGLEQVIESLTRPFHLTKTELEIWVNKRNPSSVPSVLRLGKSVVLILPLGFLKTLRSKPDTARAILAHEFGHVLQKDIDLLVLFKYFSTLFVRLVFPIILTVSVFGLLMSFLTLLSNRDRYDTYVGQQIIYGPTIYASMCQKDGAADATDISEACAEMLRTEFERGEEIRGDISESRRGLFIGFRTIIIYFLLLKGLQYIVFRSERVADLGAMVLTNRQTLEEAIRSNMNPRETSERIWFGSHPTALWRIKKIEAFAFRFPAVENMYSEKVTT